VLGHRILKILKKRESILIGTGLRWNTLNISTTLKIRRNNEKI